MGFVSVKLPIKAKPLLHQLKISIMKKRGEYVPDGEVIYEALKIADKKEESQKGSWEAIGKYAGSLEITEKEAEKWISEIREERKKWRFT
ncbi:hypothetical protein HY989_02620 [Candidatus Micrarchaeota archaeon]|nr:hypothetical protein [Candidatus Micrarchaeota archaeon]